MDVHLRQLPCGQRGGGHRGFGRADPAELGLLGLEPGFTADRRVAERLGDAESGHRLGDCARPVAPDQRCERGRAVHHHPLSRRHHQHRVGNPDRRRQRGGRCGLHRTERHHHHRRRRHRSGGGGATARSSGRDRVEQFLPGDQRRQWQSDRHRTGNAGAERQRAAPNHTDPNHAAHNPDRHAHPGFNPHQHACEYGCHAGWCQQLRHRPESGRAANGCGGGGAVRFGEWQCNHRRLGERHQHHRLWLRQHHHRRGRQ